MSVFWWNKAINKDKKLYKLSFLHRINDKFWWLYKWKKKILHRENCPGIPDHPYRILIIGESGCGKTNALLNLINNQPDIDEIYLYAKDP